ncbi:NADPH dehydrogenase 1 [Rhizoctonia solani AG-1 IB]|uniref:NADPH dehydrogenase 1 n=1 Tax=Thanatephorus cucumeris (strain AG1-IB / isolate 7/3/14) TaxID=1108050 RepID=M5CHE1_THACB|nr:NADPH dehydrogenase 1 [Rhizoctonia solani AG-1 IB]
MAPLTRYRANDSHAHTELGVQYYAQRAEVPGTLLVTEGTLISPEAGGYDRVPGIWSDEQIAAWKKVTDAVHERHSYIYLQLWALGRAADPKVLAREGLPFVSVSPVPIEEGGPVPRALSEEEIKRYVEQYAQAAENAVSRAGFDGVEIHSANGYLLDQFLQDNSNKRTDRYGGSVENRGRFVLEVVKAVAAAVGENKTAIRFSPWTRFQGMRMQDPIPTFSYVIKELSEKHSDLAYVHFVEPILEEAPTQDIQTLKQTESNDFAREIWGPRPFLSAGGYDAKSGEEAVNKHDNSAIVFGRHFISNPDLPERLRKGLALTHYDRNTFYSPGPKGYVDYPRAGEVQA